MRWNPFRKISAQILLTAVCMVFLRIALFDYQILTLEVPPNHDMFEGNAWFSTNMHALRESGDLAWWMPERNNGYAQYYQSFLSPAGPTPGYLPFVIWAGCMKTLNVFGIAVPEYLQFVLLTYVVMSFLMYCAFGYFAYELFRDIRVVCFASIVVALSSIGIWNSAFLNFQEMATLFFLLGSLMRLLRKPYARSYWVFALALVIQAAATNYWTLYNIPFYVIFLGAHAWAYRTRWRRLFVRTRSLWQDNKLAMTSAIAATALVILVWLGMLASIFIEQSNVHTRTFAAQGYDPSSMYKYPVRAFTLNFFLPTIPDHDAVHHGRYIGAELIPLLGLVPLLRWRRETRFLLLVAAGTFFLCWGPEWFAKIWMSLPVLRNIRHLFYMYTHYLQIIVVLLACSTFTLILRKPLAKTTRNWLFTIALTLAAASAAICWNRFWEGNRGLFLLPMVIVASTVAVGLILTKNRSWRSFGYATLMLMTIVDLGRYFHNCSVQDIKTSLHRWTNILTVPIPAEITQTLRRPWKTASGAQGFHADLFANQPMNHYMWPVNNYVQPTSVFEARKRSNSVQQFLFEGIPVQWIEGQRIPVADNLPLEEAVPANIVIFEDNTAIMGIVPERDPQTDWRHWNYNSFEFQVDTPRQGYLLLRQIYDPLWRFTIDGVTATSEPADQVLTALQIEPGKHLIRMEFWPVARRVYPFAIAALATYAIIFIIGAWKAGPLRIRSSADS